MHNGDSVWIQSETIGDVAQLGERRVRNAEVTGSNPVISTISKGAWRHFLYRVFRMYDEKSFYDNSHAPTYAVPRVLADTVVQSKGDSANNLGVPFDGKRAAILS